MKTKWLAVFLAVTFLAAAAAVTAEVDPDRCTFCSATGKVTCKACWGNTGRVDCPDCHRTGKVNGENCETCGGTKYVKCSDCDGTGKVACPKCDGTGKDK
jgi:hypothetical protein